MRWSDAEPLLMSSSGTFVPREQQHILAESIERTVLKDRNLVAQAPTGTGKTYAYLVPFIGNGQKVMIATGTKILQDQVKEDLAFLQSALDVPFTWTVLKGRSNYLCAHRAVNAALTKTQKKKVTSLLNTATSLYNGDRADLPTVDDHVWSQICSDTDYCAAHRCSSRTSGPICWAKEARNRAAECDIVSINHHLLFIDRALQLRNGGDAVFLPPYDYLVIDEAHKAADTARVCLGYTVTKKALTTKLEDVRKSFEQFDLTDPDVFTESVNSAYTEIQVLFKEPEAGESRTIDEHVVARLHGSVDTFSSIFAEQAGSEKSADLITTAGVYLNSLNSVVSNLHRSFTDDKYAAWWDEAEQPPKIILAKIDIRGSLPPVPTAFMSATLFPKGNVGYYPKQFDLEDYDTLALQSPFHLESQVLGYASSRDTLPAEVPLEEIRSLVQASKGRALILFTNRKNMEKTAEYLKETIDYPVYVQGEDTVFNIAGKFKDDVNSVLCATRSFFEGVNFPGETCSLVIMAALPFAHPDDALVKARQRFLENRNVNTFVHYTLPEMLITFEQAVGRAIRTVDDKATVAILDPRLAAPSQRKQYGHDVARCLKGVKWTYKVADVEAFFGSE